MLHNFFRLLESRPEFTFPSRLLAPAIGPDAERALCHARVLVPKGPATWYTCVRNLSRCRRSAAISSDGADLHLLCGGPSGDCPTEIVPADELGQHALDEVALARLLQDLFGVAGQSTRFLGPDRPLQLGRMPGDHQEIWFWIRPDEPAFSMWMGELEKRSRDGHRALVLVPTSRRVHEHTFARYAAGQPVEVAYLDRALTVAGVAIVRAPPTGAPPPRVAWADTALVDRLGVRLRVPPGLCWTDVFIEYVNGDTVAVRFGTGHPERLSAADFGLKSEMDGRPNRLWQLLLALCLGDGMCSRADVDAHNLGVLRTRATRLSKQLCAVFGLEDVPVHVHQRDETVRADFAARRETRRASTHRREPE